MYIYLKSKDILNYGNTYKYKFFIFNFQNIAQLHPFSLFSTNLS